MNRSTPELPPLALYIHTPWCVKKCPYCDFNSHNAADTLPEQSYLQALLQDLDSEMESVQGRSIHSIFIGGGTPSLLSPSFYDRLFVQLNKRLHIPTEAEVTLEANPGTFEQRRFSGFRAAGINRLSIGVQSFDDAALARLGRIHSAEQAAFAVAIARRAGFDNINLDLMHGLPDQTAALALLDVRQAITLEPDHISWYQLTIEPNTLFWRHRPQLPAENTLADIEQQGQIALRESAYLSYEISAYSRPARQSSHNINYWQFGDFIGLGAGAHGKLTRLGSGQIKRRWKTRLPARYITAPEGRRHKERTLSQEDLVIEFMMNALRLKSGVTAELFTHRTGLPLTVIEQRVAEARRRQLMTDDPLRLCASSKGQRFLNELLDLFCPEPNSD